ncbi:MULTISPECIES: HK97 family phage prohead protease [Lactococcus]|jgi:HK97 family phage prohead protease|uniref:HK97 family phage prohead protease n=1 Tax=Lactococcus TaxID=1357 RepID=UPI00143209A1|nr:MULTISPECIES: HK97 family phage prohead protease [Lactococcus]KAF6609680.1 HK97 family phage prohead protease [Lactococcus sp. EKM201L]KAF6613688.1 HK97 family phage prohead protease [Lactococcus sp. EKM203L]KAF6640685.1 HK97 family phage prohead protease [Lactococcus sp. EKM501L]KAF6645949.1 HK97 family phage prohead protease [Lactococcus sp. EKM502L]KAF6651629.1 HK97 family phage prohead protease [Lactococcus sp. EKM101L]
MKIAKKKETRVFNISQLSTRAEGEEKAVAIEGYAAVFNSKTSIGGWFDEVIEPGAFSRSLSDNGDIRALFNHNWDNVLGRTKSQTLELREDEKGLNFKVELPDTSVARDLTISMERGDINQCSFGFFITDEEWNYNVEPALRTIKEVELFEISIVSIPAYDDTEASLVRSKEIGKSIEARTKLIKQIDSILEEK